MGASCNSFNWNVTLANSKGFAGSYRRSLINCGGGFQGGEGTNLFEDYWGDSSTQLADLKPPEELGKIAVERMVRLLGGRTVETQNVPVVFDPQMGAWLLGFLAQCLSGISIARRQSFLADKLGHEGRQRAGQHRGRRPAGRRARRRSRSTARACPAAGSRSSRRAC